MGNKKETKLDTEIILSDLNIKYGKARLDHAPPDTRSLIHMDEAVGAALCPGGGEEQDKHAESRPGPGRLPGSVSMVARELLVFLLQ